MNASVISQRSHAADTRAAAAGQGGESVRPGWIAAWNQFWFTPSDPFPLAVVRIGTGLLLAWSSFAWLLDVDAFFGPAGWLPAHEVWRMNDQPWQWSWYFAAAGSPTLRWVLGIVTLVSGLTLAAGLATRLSAVVAFAGLVSAANRAPLNVFGLDDTLGILLISLIIGPAGACLSADRWLQGRLLVGVQPGKGGRLAANASSLPSVSATIALRLLQVHLCVVYFFSGCGKLLGPSWWEGMALWGAAANGQYRTLDLTWMADQPMLINAITLTTLFWEVSYAALVWPRLTRPFAIGMGISVHLGIGLAMGMMEFGLAMIVANLAFVPAATWRRWTGAFGLARVD